MGNRYDAEGALGNRESGRCASRYSKTCSTRSAAHLRPAVPSCRRRTGPNSVPAWTRLHPDDGAISGCKQKLRYAVNDKMGLEP
jgi:hypothetical protein